MINDFGDGWMEKMNEEEMRISKLKKQQTNELIKEKFMN